MKRLYTEKWKGKRTTITIDPKLKKKIEELLGHNETFGEFVREAINQDIWSKKDRKRSEMSSTEQYHKMMQLEEDVEELQKDHVTAKELTILELEIMRIEEHTDKNYKELLEAANSRIRSGKWCRVS